MHTNTDPAGGHFAELKGRRIARRVVSLYVVISSIFLLLIFVAGWFLYPVVVGSYSNWVSFFLPLLSVTAAIMVIMFTVAYFVMRDLVFVPLEKLTKSTLGIVQGDGDSVVGIDRNDEIGQLARSVKSMYDISNEANSSIISLLQEKEHQMHLMATIDEVAVVLLGISDDNIKDFNASLHRGLTEVCKCGNVDSIFVLKNNENTCEMQYVFEGDRPLSIGKFNHSYSYDDLEGWHELLSQNHNVNIAIGDTGGPKWMPISEDAKSLLVVPVFLQNEFWGIVWFENYSMEEKFDNYRAELLRFASIMIVSAIHRKSHADVIQESTLRQRVMLDAMPISCQIWNAQGQMIDANQKSVNFFGFNSKTELTQSFDKISPEYQTNGRRSADLAAQYIRQAFDEGMVTFEWLHCMPETKEPIPSKITLIRIKYTNQHVVVGYLLDLREQQRMLKEIENREYLLTITNSAANVLLQSKVDTFASSLFRALSMMAQAVAVERVYVWEYKQDDDVERGYFNQVYEWVGDIAIFERQNKEIRYGEKEDAFFHKMRTRASSVAGFVKDIPESTRDILELSGVKSYLMIPIFLDKKLWGVIGFNDMNKEREFSESQESILMSGGLLVANALLRHEMTKNIQEALIDAQAASNAKSSFLSTMSHEMRTPMNAITGMCSVGRAAEDINRKNYAFERIDEASKHLLGVINDVLDMSKIEAGKLELSDKQFDLRHVVGRVNAVMQFRVDEMEQKYTSNIASDVPIMLIADDQRLSQVITNLLSNAIKFTPEHKEIKMDVSLIDKSKDQDLCTLQFDIIDQGIGLSAEQQAGLFQSFVQAETSTSRKFGGTGLGLAISKHIVEMMGGKIWIESELGKGAKFSFTIRAKLPSEAQLEAERGKASKQDIATRDYTGRRILLAEDVEINREIIMAMFENTGLIFDIAENGEEAVRIFTESPDVYDLIFMDVHMPKMDGYDATRAIRAAKVPRAAEIPIVAMTANVFKEDIEKCLEAGMNAHLGKPLNVDAIKRVLSEYL